MHDYIIDKTFYIDDTLKLNPKLLFTSAVYKV